MSDQPYAELLEFNQPNPMRMPGYTKIRDRYPGLLHEVRLRGEPFDHYDHTMYDPERIIEFAGRWDYDSNDRLGQTSVDGTPIIAKWKKAKHESMLEMGEATFYIECSRVVSLELARHRHQERQEMSQRFVKFERQNAEDMFIRPPGLTEVQWDGMLAEYVRDFETYVMYREQGMSPQDARYILPNGFKTKMVVKMNTREWRHVLRLRLDKSAQPEMRLLMEHIYNQLSVVFPNVFDDVLDSERAVR